MAESVTIDYTNHRGERALRVVQPIRIWHGSTDWHTEPQWLLEAHDASRGALRNFAMRDIHRWIEGDDHADG